MARERRDPPTAFERTRYYRRVGWFERAGWALLATVIVAAALGAFGDGWLSRRAATSDDGALHVRYERIGRSDTPNELELRWQARGGDSTLWIENAFLERFELETITPPPSGAAVDSVRTYFTFRTHADGAQARAIFKLAPRTMGEAAGGVGQDDGAAVPVRQFVFP